MDKVITLSKEFIDYCKLNNINDIDSFVNETFQRGFTVVKYGTVPEKIKNNIVSQNKQVVENKNNTKKDIYAE